MAAVASGNCCKVYHVDYVPIGSNTYVAIARDNITGEAMNGGFSFDVDSSTGMIYATDLFVDEMKPSNDEVDEGKLRLLIRCDSKDYLVVDDSGRCKFQGKVYSLRREDVRKYIKNFNGYQKLNPDDPRPQPTST